MSKDKTIQDKMDELNEIFAWFQGDEFKLEMAKDKLTGATELSKEIESDLKTITNDINEIKKSFKSDES